MINPTAVALKRGLLFFWAAWLTVVFTTNALDGLKTLGVLAPTWPFASGNYRFLAETTARYGSPGWLDGLLFLGVVAWEAVAAALFWRAGGFWRNARRALTFPLEAGGWSNGAGVRYVPLPGVSFASGPSLPLRYYQSLAVDPRLIPMRSRVYIPAYRRWFTAQDTGGAIGGAHVDVFRPPPSSPDGAQYRTNQRIYVVPPGQRVTTPPATASPPAPAGRANGGSSSG